jgi:hypothetical protein
MTREEYEERKRRLGEQLRAGIELLEAANRQQLRALDLVWMTTAEEEVALPPLTAEALSRPQAQPAAAPPPAPPAPPPRPARRAAWQLQNEVETALAGVPDVFDRNDLCRALGYEPDRGSLYRALQQLITDGAITRLAGGSGKTPSRYKKTGAGASPAGG